MVYIWYIYGIYMVYIWYIYGICMVYMSGFSEKWAMTPQNLQFGELRSDELPCSHLPTLAFLEGLGSDLDISKLVICTFNSGVGVKMQKFIFSKRIAPEPPGRPPGCGMLRIFYNPLVPSTPQNDVFLDSLAPALFIKKKRRREIRC